MNQQQQALVRAGFSEIAPKAEKVAALFYNRLFEIDPSLRPLFRGDMKEQGRKLVAVLATAVAHLDRLDQIVPRLRELGHNHMRYGVKDSDYNTVAAALLWTLEAGLDAKFTPQAREAWTACYLALAGEMKAGASLAAEASKLLHVA